MQTRLSINEPIYSRTPRPLGRNKEFLYIQLRTAIPQVSNQSSVISPFHCGPVSIHTYNIPIHISSTVVVKVEDFGLWYFREKQATEEKIKIGKTRR